MGLNIIIIIIVTSYERYMDYSKEIKFIEISYTGAKYLYFNPEVQALIVYIL
jgi:hypothetical protein